MLVENNEQSTYICRRCGRKLKNPESIALGFGTTCYKRFLAQPTLKPLFTVKPFNDKEVSSMQSIGLTMRKHRKNKNLTINELADKSGVHKNTIINCEKDKIVPSLYTLIDLADTLNVSLDEYIGRTLKK